MTTALVFEIINLAVSLVQSEATGATQTDATVANTLLQIVHKGAQAYTQATGQPLDPTLIKVENPI